MIKLSLITVTYNDLKGLKRTFDSITNLLKSSKDIDFIEHVVIDGDSIDGTKDFLDQVSPIRSIRTRFISESDQGIYDAMNKGVAESEGDFVVFLNAGDEVYKSFDVHELLLMLDESMLEKKQAGIAFSSIITFANKKFTIKSRLINKNRPRLPTIHQSMIFKRDVLLDIPFDITYKVCGDYDNFSNIYSHGLFFKPVDKVFSVFYAGGISSKSPTALFYESISITKKYFELNLYRRILSMSLLVFSLLRYRVLIFIYETIDDN